MIEPAFDRSSIYELASRIAKDAGCKAVMRGFHHPERDPLAVTYPLAAVIFDEQPIIENRAAGGRYEHGKFHMHLWVKPMTPNTIASRNEAWSKLDKIAKAVQDRLNVPGQADGSNPSGPKERVAGSDLVLMPEPFTDFFFRTEGPVGGELEIEYHIHTEPPPDQAPQAFNIDEE